MKRVLVVDDDKAILDLLSKSLAKLSYQVDTVDNGASAVLFFSQNFYDLILLDIVMPKMDGFEVLKKIRSQGESRNSPVLMISSRKDRQSVLKAISYGADDYLVKPFDIGTLLHKVSRWSNSKIEEEWKELGQEQERTLRLTLATINKGHDAVVKGVPLPYEHLKSTSFEVMKIVEKDQVKPVLDALKKHDSYTFVHSMRVGIFLSLFARRFGGFTDDDIAVVTEGGIIHDVGKAKTPLIILNKPGSFQPEEWEEMKSHVMYGVEALQRTDGIPAPIIEIAWCHHEKLDGSGYPRGLKGSDIGTLARMSAIVDMYVALTDRRVYKPSFSHEKSLSLMREQGEKLDRDLLDELAGAIEEKGYNN